MPAVLPGSSSCKTFVVPFSKPSEVYLQVVAGSFWKCSLIFVRRSGFCTPNHLRQKMRGNAQKLHLTHSNTELDHNQTNERIDALNRALRNFRKGIRIATLCGQKIASLVVNLLILFF